jgi:hypothetical protein
MDGKDSKTKMTREAVPLLLQAAGESDRAAA